MATILMTWELGGGLGHIVRLRVLGQRLVDRGHCVFAALRDLESAKPIFKGSGIRILQAPVKQRPSREGGGQIISCAHVLRNTGFGNPIELQGLASAWKQLIELVQPSAMLFDHSPTALLAARSFSVRKFIVGSGFSLPPDENPLPIIRPTENYGIEALAEDENSIVVNANTYLQEETCDTICSLSQLYYPNDGAYVFTVPKLDPFGPREDVSYMGAVSNDAGESPQWPNGHGPRVFAYLKPFKHIEGLLTILRQSGARTIAYIPGIKPSFNENQGFSNILFADSPINTNQAAKDCDFAVLNGTSTSVTQMLLAGKPMLNIPLVLEQEYTSRAVTDLGAGLIASPNRPAEIAARVFDLISGKICKPLNGPSAAWTRTTLNQLIEHIEQLT